MKAQNSASQGDEGKTWGQGRWWRDKALLDLSRAIFGEVAVFTPHPDQWEFDLGDRLPLQARPARTERSEGGQAALVRDRDA